MSAGPAVGLATCQACGSGSLEDFYSVKGIPTQSCVLLGSAEEAMSYPVGDLTLAACHECGFIQNRLFDPGLVDYSVPTEESQVYSSRFRAFSDELASDLWSRHSLGTKTVFEIGCGKGDFLVSLAGMGLAGAVGIDPGFMPDRAAAGAGEIEFIRDWFGSGHTHLTGDLVAARHLLEHVPDVLDFTRMIRQSVERTTGSVLFIELPDVGRVLDEGAFWDVYYEHCSYFTLGSLDGLLRRAGFNPVRLWTGFEGQYLLAEAVIDDDGDASHGGEDVGSLLERVASFSTAAARSIESWKETLAAIGRRGGHVAVWGGGSKAVAFLTSLPTDGVRLSVVDINPHKQGKYLPGCGVRVDAPESLKPDAPDLVVVMNPVYEGEIRAHLREMDVACEVRGVVA